MKHTAAFSNLGGFLNDIQKKKMLARKTMNPQDAMAVVEMERKNILDLNILVGVDVSGSINTSMFKSFMVQLQQIKGMSRIKVIEIGDRISAIYDFTNPNQLTAQPKRLNGGGGNGEHIFFPTAKKLKPDAILYMTDGYCVPAQDPLIPTGFILTAHGIMPYDWGEYVGRLPH